MQDRNTAVYKELITQLCIYTTAIRILAKGYLPISLITPSKLQEILSEVKIAVRKTNQDYDLVIDRPHLYYDRKLVTFCTEKERNLVIQFPVFVHQYIQQPLILYQIETVPILTTDQNTDAQSYTHLQADKLYNTLNSERYITIRQQELRTCKKIGYEGYCEELFVVNNKSKYSCKSVIYFNLNSETIKETADSNSIITKQISLLLC